MERNEERANEVKAALTEQLAEEADAEMVNRVAWEVVTEEAFWSVEELTLEAFKRCVAELEMV